MCARPATVLPPLLERVQSLTSGQDVYLVGGALRDSLLGLASHDFDLVVAGDAVSLARQVADRLRADFYVLDEAFGAARVIVSGERGERDVLDFTAARGGLIIEDLAARDFTINAMALNLKDGTTLDPLQGAADIRARTIRACSSRAMQVDPIRILRAVRLAASLDFAIDGTTRQEMKTAAGLLPNSAAERQRDELFKMLGGRRPDASMRALEMLGVFPHILPELSALKGVEQAAPHVHDAWDHTLSVTRHLTEILDLLLEAKVDNAGGILASLLMLGLGRYRQQFTDHFSASLNLDRPLRALLVFAALYHDVGKALTQSRDNDGSIRFPGHEREGVRLAVERATAFNLSRQEIARLETIIAHHMRYFFLASRMEMEGQEPSRRAIYRYFRDAADAGVDLVLLGLADVRGTREQSLSEDAWSAWVGTARTLLENLWERPREAVAPPRLLDGHDLIRDFNLQAGPVIGQLLEVIREGQAAGEIGNREDALAVARRFLEQQGRSRPAQGGGAS